VVKRQASRVEEAGVHGHGANWSFRETLRGFPQCRWAVASEFTWAAL